MVAFDRLFFSRLSHQSRRCETGARRFSRPDTLRQHSEHESGDDSPGYMQFISP
jgi:hypothetical protein